MKTKAQKFYKKEKTNNSIKCNKLNEEDGNWEESLGLITGIIGKLRIKSLVEARIRISAQAWLEGQMLVLSVSLAKKKEWGTLC